MSAGRVVSVVVLLLAASCKRQEPAVSPGASASACSSAYPDGIPKGEAMQISLSFRLDETFRDDSHEWVPTTFTEKVNEIAGGYGTTFFLSDGVPGNLVVDLSGAWDDTHDHAGVTVLVWGQEDIKVGALDPGPAVELFTFRQEPLFVTWEASIDDAAAKLYYLVTHGWSCESGVMTPNPTRNFGDGPSPWS